MKLGRRPSFKRTRPMLQHPSPETSFNQQTISVYERPASMKNWRPETMLSQDCSLDCQGIRKWRVQCPIPQVQKHYDLLLKMELGRRPSFKRTSPMLSHWEWSWATCPASEWLPSSVSQAGWGTPGWTRGSGGSGGAGLAGQTEQVGPGRARAGLAGRAWSNNPNSPIFCVFWTNC